MPSRLALEVRLQQSDTPVVHCPGVLDGTPRLASVINYHQGFTISH